VCRSTVGVQRIERPIAVAVALKEDLPLRSAVSAAAENEYRRTGRDEGRKERRPDQEGSVEPLP